MSLKALQEYTFVSRYARYNKVKTRRETWDECVDRVKNMMKEKYSGCPDVFPDIDFAYEMMRKKRVLGSQRALQFGGKPILDKPMKIFNCISSYCDRLKFFQECMWLLLCGCGTGFSVQKHHIAKLPKLLKNKDGYKKFTIEDSIEGWADSVGVLVSSYFKQSELYPEYNGHKITFDYSKIRPANAELSYGGKAPGPEPLKNALNKIKTLLDNALDNKQDYISPIQAYDIIMYCADAVISGGVRRCLPRGTEVFTKNGLIRIENIKIGDLVLTSDGYEKVTNKFEQGEQQLIKIITEDGEFTCTPNHKMAVFSSLNHYEWKEASKLLPDDRLISSRRPIEGQTTKLPECIYDKPLHSTTCTNITIPTLDTDIAWLIGAFHADGYVWYKEPGHGYSGGQLSLVFGIDELDIALKAKEQLERFTTNAIKLEKRKNENSYIVTVKSKLLAKYFYDNIKTPKTTIDVPEFIKCGTIDIRLAYLAGVADGDGALHNKPVIMCSTVYRDYAIQLQNLAYSCGIETRFAYNISQSRNEKGWQQIYSLSLITEYSREIFAQIPELIKSIASKKISRMCNSFPSKWLTGEHINNKATMGAYSNRNVTFDRVLKFNSLKNDHLVPVRVINIENSEVDMTWDIEVENKHEFFANGYLTHNSATISLFSEDDKEMMEAKTGNWFNENPQRGRSNNSVVLLKNELTLEKMTSIVENIKEYGEPAFVLSESLEHLVNPCFRGDTLVLTNNGYFPIRDLDGASNYKVKNIDGEWRDCKAFYSGKQQLYKITLDNSQEVYCTGTHKWPVMLDYEIAFYPYCDKTTKKLIHVETKDLVPNEHFLINDWEEQKILSVEKTDISEDVYDITVYDDTHTFTIDRGLVTGNCVEISFYAYDKNGKSGWQACNLSTINGSKAKTKESFLESCKAAAIIGTLQAGFSKSGYLGPISQEIIEQEALLGVSMTGIMDSPDICLNEEIQREGAKVINETNAEIARKICINRAARLTCVKPEGSASCILGTASGIHPHHARRYIRRVQSNKMDNVYQFFKQINPRACEESVWSQNSTDDVISFCIEVPDGAKTKNQLSAIDLLKFVKLTQNNWVKYGTNTELCSAKWLTHNVSNTINVKPEEWDEVTKFIFDNRDSFCGVSLLPITGDKDYPQAPFTTIYTPPEMIKHYGDGIMFISGLIEESLTLFEDNIWKASEALLGLTKTIKGPTKKAWNERCQKYANNYFNGDIKTLTYAMKDIYNYKLWTELKREYKDVDYANLIEATDDTNLIQELSCANGTCEIK